MGIRHTIGRWLLGTPARASRGGKIAGRYDAAQTTGENAKHWKNADQLGPRAAHNPTVRSVLRSRSRYEVANNTYALGITRTLANDVIGTGPRLQMRTKSETFNAKVEVEFTKWARAIDLAGKLRTMREAQAVDGEAFAQFITNPRLSTTIQLDLRLVEAEQVATPNLTLGADENVDGIRFDQYGNPVSYDLLQKHPGEPGFYSVSNETKPVPASEMIHIFRRSRPGQHRGIPETTPALPLFALLRRFTLAVVAAAEAIAEIGTGVVYSDAPANSGADAEPYETIELERNMLTVMPDGWKMNQLDPKQPTSTYSEFKKELLNECSRPWSMPFNITACNSSGYNYASGRLDHQTYYKQIAIERDDYEVKVLDRIFAEWLDEALLREDYLPDVPADAGEHVWMWDGSQHVDPAKEASAQATRLANGTTTLADEFGALGVDWRAKVDQMALEREYLASKNVTLAMMAPQLAADTAAAAQAAAESDDEDEPAPRKKVAA